MTEILVYQNEIICSIEDLSVFHGVCLECKTTTVLSSLSLFLSQQFYSTQYFSKYSSKTEIAQKHECSHCFVAWLLFNFIVSIALKLLVSKYSILFVHSLVLSRYWPNIFLIFIEDYRKSVKFVFCFLKYETPI